MKHPRFFSILAVAFLGMTLQGCSQNSYPTAQIKESIVKICRDEYGIENIDVKINGDTIGVYLPLTKLFAADFREAAVTGKVRNFESLFEFSPEATEKVEDVLFSISRVLLSAERPFKFYVLEATDVDKTGMQLVLTGHVDDIKRVRAWDISRNEYRKRLIHEIRLNRAVLWHKPVREFFQDLAVMSSSDLRMENFRMKYFGEAASDQTLKTLFWDVLSDKPEEIKKTKWEIIEIRSASMQKNQALVYTKVRTHRGGSQEPPVDLEYIFLLSLSEEKAHIVRIIPFQYKNETGILEHIPFPKELQIKENLEKWEEEFPVEDISMGNFLAQQLTRRVQALLAADERVQNTFRDVKLNFDYVKQDPAHFTLDLEVVLRDFNHYNRESLVFHEDMVYLLTLASREFVDVLRSYQFGDYGFLTLNVAQEPSPWILGRENLELFRRKKIDIQGLLSPVRV